ncbi:MAG TPA: S41 family peptidase [Rhabdochlamydiaceae bacterium]|nr:S41 family peptidase [Rhabdochlamydiaceae bacterium]
MAEKILFNTRKLLDIKRLWMNLRSLRDLWQWNLWNKGVYSLFKYRVLWVILALFCAYCEAKPPSLNPHDTHVKIEEILKAHVSHQKMTPELVKRSLLNYLDEVDPAKIYFIEPEIVKWTNPSDELIRKTLEGYKKTDYSAFEDIHEVLIAAIHRRNNLEEKVLASPLPANVQPSEFKDVSWCSSEEELLERLVRIKGLQIETAEKLNQETRDQFLQRLNKRRTHREEELIAHSTTEKRQIILSYVLKATSSALDSQTMYFTPSEANQFMIQVQQRLFGIGAQLRDDLSGFTIIRLLEGGPASQDNKLKVGDRIIAVDNEPVVGMEITEAVELIRGQEGTRVFLTILRESGDEQNRKEEKLNVEIIRGEVVLKESRLETSHEPYGDGIIAILHLYSFYQDSKSSSTTDLAQAIENFKRDHKVKAVILDLRNNAGGLLPQAVSVTGLFIKKGIVVSVKDNTHEIQHLRNIDNKIAWDGPLVVLTNRTSASASEIVAQTLQDYGRAIIVGDAQTYGKGTFQTFTLEASNYGKVNPKGEFKVTRGRYYTVSGKSPQLTGVHTDIVVPGMFSEMDIGEKFAKFPLENDKIPSNFEDDLSDIPIIHRAQIARLYKFNLQTIVNTYTPFLETLIQNSKERINQNQNYQNFLKQVSKKDYSFDPSEMCGQSDLQQEEAINITKDLIQLLDQKTSISSKNALPSESQKAA